MTRFQWATWSFGLVASTGVLLAFAFTKGGPDWYIPVFLGSCGYCLLAGLAEVYLRRTRQVTYGRDGWLSALSTARLGLVGITAVAVVLSILLIFRTSLL